MNFKQLFWRFFKYCNVGVINTAVTAIIMAGLGALGVHYLIYTAVGYGVGICVSFFLNFRFTFAASGKVKQRFIRFLVINLANLGVVELLQIFLIEFIHLDKLPAAVIGMIWYVIFGFFMNQKFVFHKVEQQ